MAKSKPISALRTGAKEVQQAAQRTAVPFLPSLRVELLGNKQAVVDGCKGIIEYTDQSIRLSGEKQIVKFVGTALELQCFDESGAVVVGNIVQVEFC